MPVRAHAAIRSILRASPETEVRFVEALTTDTYFLKEGSGSQVLFVNPVHRELVDRVRAASAGE